MSEYLVDVVGLGPADSDLMPAVSAKLITGCQHVFIRTLRHPAAESFPSAKTFDDLYEQHERIEDVYKAIVDELIAQAKIHKHIVYAVPGSPRIAEFTVSMLEERAQNNKDEHVKVRVHVAPSFLDLAWNALRIDPVQQNVRLIDGHNFAAEAAGERGPLLVGQCDSQYVLSEIKLAFDENPPEKAVVLQRLGCEDEVVFEVAWEDLDRNIEPDHLTSLYIEHVAVPVAAELLSVHELSRTLREKCPWDAEQTHESLKKYALEETYELLDAISNLSDDETDGRGDEHLIEELGDVLYQVFAHAAIAEQQGRFSIADVCTALVEKLTLRHPHVFGDVEVEDAAEVKANWERNKVKEKKRKSITEGVPNDLPALVYAVKLLERARAAGIDVSNFAQPDGSATAQSGEARLESLKRIVAASSIEEDLEGQLRTAINAFFPKSSN